MKKCIKNIMFLLTVTVLSFVPIINVNALKDFTCEQVTNLEYCPAPGIDKNGNACRIGYLDGMSGLKCLKVDNPKECGNYTGSTCPDMDDYGNTCTKKYVGSEFECKIETPAVYTPLKTCGDYTYQEGCPDYDYNGSKCAKDSTGQCYVSDSKKPCNEIKSSGICNGRKGECTWISYSTGTLNTEQKSACFSIIEPNSYSQECTKITGEIDCKVRTDCLWFATAGSSKRSCHTKEQLAETQKCEELTPDECRQYPDDCKIYVPEGSLSSECSTIIKVEDPSCYAIKDRKQCALTTGCKITYGSNSKFICEYDENDYTSGASFDPDDAYFDPTKIKVSFKCSDVKYLTSAWTLLRIAAPFLVILLGSLDFFKAMTAGDEKKMKESRGKFIKRLIAFGLFILLPFVVQFIFSVMGTYGSENVCLIKCVVTNDTSDKGCD